ncbi:hypothetical protein QQF64_009541 [Cirrhinus molitorella]|uniref:Reverse transcriptase domain-containing protein n=1 Tax=Cirrhinus molitorella TaxID=172907 RepID=A0ABR3M1F4_9TELE
MYRTDGRFFNLNRFKAKSKINYTAITESQYSDNNVIVAHSAEDLQGILNAFAKAYRALGLKLNMKKTQENRAVHTSNPDTGLRRAWERLEDCYGSPEIIEKSLFDRIDSFSKIGNRNVKRLQELGDLLQEVESAKQESCLPGLFYLDNTCGVAPIVEKLPYSLQEKKAQSRNDPSFALAYGIHNVSKLEQPVKKQVKSSIYTHKTEVLSGAATQTCSSKGKLEHVNKTCLIHKKPHPLKCCRVFRSKPLDELKTFLKEEGVCFRTTIFTHLPSLPEQGGERGIDEALPDVTSKCTEACKGRMLSIHLAYLCRCDRGRGEKNRRLRVKEKFEVKPLPEISLACDTFIFDDYAIGDTIFERSKDDNKVGLSIEVRCFLEIMDESNSWVAPLPFKTPRQLLPNNKDQALTA